MCHMPHSYHPPWLTHPNNIGWRVQIMKLLLMHFSEVSCHFVPCQAQIHSSVLRSSYCLILVYFKESFSYMPVRQHRTVEWLWPMRWNNGPVCRQSHICLQHWYASQETSRSMSGLWATLWTYDLPKIKCSSMSLNSTAHITRTVRSYLLRCGCHSPQFHNPINISTDSCWSRWVEATLAHCSTMLKVLLLQDKHSAHLRYVTSSEISAV